VLCTIRPSDFISRRSFSVIVGDVSVTLLFLMSSAPPAVMARSGIE
jgi:hypothetical protein